MKSHVELPENILNLYLQDCIRKKGKKKEILFGEKEAPDYIYLVIQGKVRVFLNYPNGKEFTITYLERGGVYSGHARGYGMAMTSETEIALIQVKVFKRIMEDNPAFMLSVMAVLGEALKNTVNIIENLAFREVEDRLRHFLLQSMERNGKKTQEGILLEIEFTQEEIATTIGCTRQTVSTQLKQLVTEGVIRIRNRRIMILKPYAIEEHE